MGHETHIVTDSTACLSKKDITRYNIGVAPLSVIIDGKTHRDGVDIDSETFTLMQQNNKNLKVTTSLPSGEDFKKAYDKFSNGKILSIHIGSIWSGTLGVAERFSSMEEYSNVIPIDSRTMSAPLGNMVLTAARLAENGNKIKDIISYLKDLISRSMIFAIFDDLEYPFRGGRISRANYAAGTLLKIKPIMQIADNSKITEVMKKIGIGNAVKAAEEIVLDLDPQELFALEGGSEKSSKISDRIVKDLTEKTHNEIPISKSKLGTVLGAHAGPDVFGIALVSKKPLFKKN
jgi:DegV family protein with EDD domain